MKRFEMIEDLDRAVETTSLLIARTMLTNQGEGLDGGVGLIDEEGAGDIKVCCVSEIGKKVSEWRHRVKIWKLPLFSLPLCNSLSSF